MLTLCTFSTIALANHHFTFCLLSEHLKFYRSTYIDVIIHKCRNTQNNLNHATLQRVED